MEIAVNSFVILATILCGIVSIIQYHVRRLPLYKAAARASGPPCIPIIGNALHFFGNSDELLNKMIKLVETYPAPLRFWLGNSLFFGVHSAEHLKVVFLSPKTLDKGEVYRFARPWMGNGLFTSTATTWRAHRKIISPAFNSRLLESFVEVFTNQSRILLKKLETKVDGPEFGIFHYVSLCTLDIICEAAMGIHINAQTDKNSRFVGAAKRAFEVMVERMSKIWLQSDIIFNCTQLAKDEREALDYLHGVTDYVVQQKRIEQSKENAEPGRTPHNVHQSRRKTLLDMLIELSNGGTEFSDEELRDEVDTMIIAGSDTSATTHCFVLLMLASHPEIQEKVYEELCEIYGRDGDDRDVKYEDLHRMEYLERVIKETMRLFPVAPLLMRGVTDDLKLDDEHTLPKGSSVVVGIIQAHRNEEYWPDPLTFNPDRFLPEETAKRHPFCYVPFSAGPRNCPGLKYAMISMKTLLATILRKYAFKKDVITPVKDIKIKAYLIIQPMETIMLRIERRKPTKSNSI